MMFQWITSHPYLFGAAAIPLAVLAASWVIGGLLIAPAHRTIGPPPPELDATEISLVSRSGSTIKGWWSDSPSSQATILLLHGVRGDRRSMLGRAKLLKEAGYSVLLIDFQAHGESRGSHITFGYLERHDVIAALEFVKSKHPEHPVGIIGSSLGGAATLLAGPHSIDGLVLESVYPTIEEAVEDRARMRLGPFGFVLSKLLLLQLKPRLGIWPSELRPIDKLGQVSCPVLIASGDQDRRTTIQETERMYAAAKSPKKLVVFRGAAHVDLLTHDRELYERNVLGFFRECLLERENAAHGLEAASE